MRPKSSSLRFIRIISLATVGITITSCATSATTTGKLLSSDNKKVCIELPTPEDDESKQCYPFDQSASADIDAFKVGDTVILSLNNGRIASIRKAGPPG